MLSSFGPVATFPLAAEGLTDARQATPALQLQRPPRVGNAALTPSLSKMSIITPIDLLPVGNTFVCQHAEHDFGANVADNFAWEVEHN
jgi:hypothetical protein